MYTTIENDGFLYADITNFEVDVLKESVGVIFEQFEGQDNEICEALIQDEETLLKLLDCSDSVIVYELGKKSDLLADWQEAKERNNESRDFDFWLSDKIENLFY